MSAMSELAALGATDATIADPLECARLLLPERRADHTHAGRATYDGATGEWELRYGAASSTIGGPAGLDAFARSLESHGFTVDNVTDNGAGRISCDLYRLDWSFAP